MGDSLAVDQDTIRATFEFGKSFQENRGFPERKKPGDVRERAPPPGRGAFQEGQIGIGKHKKGGEHFFICAAVRNVSGRDRFERSFGRLEPQLFPQLLLNPDGPSGSDFPRMAERSFQFFTTEVQRSQRSIKKFQDVVNDQESRRPPKFFPLIPGMPRNPPFAPLF
jgi:hypothetical protein